MQATIPHRIRTEPFALHPGHIERYLTPPAANIQLPQMALRRDTVGPVYENGAAMIPQLEMIGDVALIRVSGALMTGVTFWDFFIYGAYDYQWLSDLHAQAIEQNPRAILIDWDSPGGSVVGGTEMREQLAATQCELVHFTRAYMASMAYRLATTGQIFATPTSIVGCIGAIAVYTDSSVAASTAGLQVLAFTSDGTGNPSPLKALGNPGIAITDEQKSFVQNRVHESAKGFRDEVLAAFPGATGDAMRGGWVYGSQAVTDKLITGTVPNLETLIAAI